LIDAAIQAPSALNAQPWAFGVTEDRVLLRDYEVRDSDRRSPAPRAAEP
jgi:nitroreductase